MSVLVMIGTAAIIIVLVKYGLVRGVNQLATALGWTAKARGQATGFATSVPELVCLVAAGVAGVWDAGLWNIAASNIINALLMAIAMVAYRQTRELWNRRFVDEVGFAALAVVVPVVLMQLGLDEHWSLVPILVAFFVVYRVVDRMANPPDDREEPEAAGTLPAAIVLLVTALSAIVVAGIFLGDSAEEVVNQLGLHPAIAGWILGAVTSLPEMVTFFAVYAAAKEAGKLDSLADTQEVLDNLAASNMANVGVVYPVGLAAYLVAVSLGGG